MQHMKPALLAARVRIIPVSEDRDEVCIKLEFYGCIRNGVAAYTVPQGEYLVLLDYSLSADWSIDVVYV